jgi:GNAT superfamily N-acetyltransferase
MARRLAHLTLDNLCDLPDPCRACGFWELDPVRRDRAARAGEAGREKESWVSRVLLEWGSCGRVAYVDGKPAGHILYAPPSFVPGAETFPTAPVSEDAVLLVTATVLPEQSHAGLGRMLVQAVAKDLLQRGGIRAVPADAAGAEVGAHLAGRGGGSAREAARRGPASTSGESRHRARPDPVTRLSR